MKKVRRNNLAKNFIAKALTGDPPESIDPITIIEASRLWTKIGLLSFGGPAAHIALMHREIVIERGWLSEQQFTNALSFCMLLPGPEAMQLATYSGWRLHGVRGGFIAGGLFILPGALVMLALAIGYVYFGTIGWVESLFFGLKAGISVIVFQALVKLAKRGLTRLMDWLIAIAGFVGIFFANVPFPLIIASAALYGFYASHSTIDRNLGSKNLFRGGLLPKVGPRHWLPSGVRLGQVRFCLKFQARLLRNRRFKHLFKNPVKDMFKTQFENQFSFAERFKHLAKTEFRTYLNTY